MARLMRLILVRSKKAVSGAPQPHWPFSEPSPCTPLRTVESPISTRVGSLGSAGTGNAMRGPRGALPGGGVPAAGGGVSVTGCGAAAPIWVSRGTSLLLSGNATPRLVRTDVFGVGGFDRPAFVREEREERAVRKSLEAGDDRGGDNVGPGGLGVIVIEEIHHDLLAAHLVVPVGEQESEIEQRRMLRLGHLGGPLREIAVAGAALDVVVRGL